MSKVELTLAHRHGGKKAGDTIKADPDEARRLVEAGYASYSTKADEKQAVTPATK